MDQVDHALSLAAAKRIKAVQKRCWYNALFAMRLMPELARAVYVEGWLVPDDMPMPIEHGWCELPDGRIVDPTLPGMVGTYFAGVRYTQQDTLRFVDLPHVWQTGG